MQAVLLSRAGGIARIIICGLIAGVFILAVLSLRYPNLGNVSAYKVFREYARFTMNIKTRDWHQVEGTHFIVRYQDKDTEMAKMVLDTSEEAFCQVNKVMGYIPQGKIPVVLYPDALSLNRSFGWAADESAMGVYWAGVIRVLSPDCWINGGNTEEVFKSDGPMAHEYTHFVVDQIAAGNYPRWLTEGIAQQVERKVTGFQIALTGPEEIYPLAKMDREFDLLPNQSAAYRQSLAMVDFLTTKFGDDGLREVLHRLGQGESLNQAFATVFGISIGEFEEQFLESVR